MKRSFAFLLSVLLFLSPALCAAEDALPGGLLALEEGRGYTMTYDPSGDSYQITSPDGTVFTCDIDSCKELGISEEFMRMLLPSMAGTTQEGLSYGETTGEVNGFLYITMNYYGFLYGFTAIGGGAVLFVYVMGAEDIAAYEALLGVLRPANGEAPADPAFSASFGVGDLAGFYDLDMLGEKHTDATLIFIPGGHGRMSNPSGSVVFDYEIRDGQIVLLDTDGTTITREQAGKVVLHSEGLDLTFVRRDPVAGSPRMTGKWKAVKMITNGVTIDSSMLSILGLAIEFTAYDDGTMDWYAVSDTTSWAAQGWGIDENGLYLYNGSRNPCSLEGGDLVLSMNGNSSQIFFSYMGPVE